MPVVAVAESIRQSTLSEISEDELATNEVSVFLNKKFKYLEEGAEPSEHASQVSAKLLVDRCMMLNRLEQYQESVEVCNKVITRFSQTPFTELKAAVAIAHAIQANNLVSLKRYEEALISYDQSTQFLRQKKIDKAQHLIAQALLEKAEVLSEMHRVDDELALYSQIISEFGQSKDTQLQRNVATAYLNQAYVFSDLKRKKEMLYNLATVISHYASSDDTELKDMVAHAYNGRGFEYFLEAKKAWTTDNRAALQQLQLAKADFTHSVQLANSDETKAMVYGNQAYTLWLQGDAQQAEVKLKQALILDGSIFETTLDDIKQYPTPLDSGFKALLERLWKQYQDTKS